jgi:hypothetical protein
MEQNVRGWGFEAQIDVSKIKFKGITTEGTENTEVSQRKTINFKTINHKGHEGSRRKIKTDQACNGGAHEVQVIGRARDGFW